MVSRHLTAKLSGRAGQSEYGRAHMRSECARHLLAPSHHGPLQRKLGIAQSKLLWPHRMGHSLIEADHGDAVLPEHIRILGRMPVKGTVHRAPHEARTEYPFNSNEGTRLFRSKGLDADRDMTAEVRTAVRRHTFLPQFALDFAGPPPPKPAFIRPAAIPND